MTNIRYDHIVDNVDILYLLGLVGYKRHRPKLAGTTAGNWSSIENQNGCLFFKDKDFCVDNLAVGEGGEKQMPVRNHHSFALQTQIIKRML